VVLVGVVAAVHFGYIVYLALGGFAAWRWPRLLLCHVAAVAWGCSTIAFGLPCPLTAGENLLRERAGLASLGAEGFAGHYLSYPAGPVRGVFAVLVLGSWLGMWARGRVRGGEPRLVRMSR
jgi:hypothetical protein